MVCEWEIDHRFFLRRSESKSARAQRRAQASGFLTGQPLACARCAVPILRGSIYAQQQQ
jgi:hypothetical protein